MARDDPVRSVGRALQILRVLQVREKATLADLQQATALPKPTLLRLLHTLEIENMVWRAAGDGLWRPVFEMRRTRILTQAHQRLIDVAMPALEALRAKVVWPSDLAVRDGSRMLLLETTRRSSGLAVNRDEIGHRIDMVRSAVGRAYLAACPPQECEEIAHLIAGERELPLAVVGAQLREAAQAVRKLGYARRAADFGGRDASIQAFDDHLAALAIPVVVDAVGVLCCINIVWLKRFDALASIVNRHLDDLRETARRIAADWART